MIQPNRNRRQVWWAVLASLVLHLLIGLSLAAFAGRPQDLVLEEEAPPQLTIMQLAEATPPPLVPKNPPMTTVDPARKSAVAPQEKTFEANENSIAAAEKAATTESQLPGQDGKDRPFMNLEEHENTFASAGAQPQPKPTPTMPPKEEPTPKATPALETPTPAAPTPAPNQFALLTQTPTPIPSPPEAEQNTEIPMPTATPTPTPEPSATPPTPASEYRDFQQKTVIRGGINNRGRSAVNAVGTPQGRYKKLLEDAVGSRWYYYMKTKADLVSIGTTSVTFEILADGSIQNLRVTENTTTEATASMALRSIQETKFPPIPDDLLATLPEGRFTMEETFTIFANR
jgi:outer membrane biosynthesis protein TonB